MKYTSEDIVIGCSFKRNPKEINKLICVSIIKDRINFIESNTFVKYDYPLDVVLAHLNTSVDIDFQKTSQSYEIY